jgi:hypothetical protein
LLGITAQRNLKYHPKFGASWNEPNDVARKQTKRKRRQIQTEALVDTGASRFYLQRRVIKALGLCPLSEITSRTMSDRVEKRTVSSSVKLAILRSHRTLRCHPTARHTAEHHRQIPLEHLDRVVGGPRGCELIPDPEHKRGEMVDES